MRITDLPSGDGRSREHVVPVGARPVRVVIADDQTLFREALARLLQSEDGIDVVGAAADGEEAVKLVGLLRPDVVLIDVHMPRLDGIRATARIVARHPSVRVLILSASEPEESVVGALRAGAVGYILKDAGRKSVVESIMRAAAGRQVLSRDGQRVLVTAALGRTVETRPPAGLSGRQFQILRSMSSGLTFKQIGQELGLSEKTVRNQASLLYAKLGVHDRAGAILYAVHKGLAA